MKQLPVFDLYFVAFEGLCYNTERERGDRMQLQLCICVQQLCHSSLHFRSTLFAIRFAFCCVSFSCSNGLPLCCLHGYWRAGPYPFGRQKLGTGLCIPFGKLFGGTYVIMKHRLIDFQLLEALFGRGTHTLTLIGQWCTVVGISDLCYERRRLSYARAGACNHTVVMV